MTLPRRVLIDPQQTPYYHCVSRCVRRAFLCGEDRLTGKNFNHRRGWIEARLQRLATIFAIDLCAYAVMSNHYHVVLHINTPQQQSWSDTQVIARWQQLYRIPDWLAQANADDPRRRALLSLWRERLGSISWYMKCINEPLARMANAEDGCKGRFWEGRFKSQALLDDAAVLKVMAYVDLNPIRAQLAPTPEQSDHTSIQARLQRRACRLAPMADAPTRAEPADGSGSFQLPITTHDYGVFVDTLGRQLQHGKCGQIDNELPLIWQRLAPAGGWLDELRHLASRYCRAIGNRVALAAYRDALGQQRLRGVAQA